MRTRNFDLPRYLSMLPLFEGAAPANLKRIAADCQLRRLGRGDMVFRVGKPCTALNVTVTGQIKLFGVSAAGQEKVIELAGPGVSLAEESVFSGRPYTVNAQALTDSMLLAIGKRTLLAEIGRDSHLALRTLAGIGRRLQGLMREIESQALHSGPQRVIAYLLRDLGCTDRSAATVSLPVSKATIASRLSLTPEYFSRVLHELESAGLIRIDHRAIRIHDPKRLGDFPLAA